MDVKSQLNKFDNMAQKSLNVVFGSVWVQGLLYLLVILYATKFAPALPRSVMGLVDNQFFQVLVFFLVIFSAKYSPSTALIISIAFLMTMNYVNNMKMFEKMETELKEQVLESELNNTMGDEVPQVAEGEVMLPPIVVEPKVVSTKDGTPMVVNPQVIVAPKTVIAPNGDKVVVVPEVSTLAAPQPPQPPAPLVQQAPQPQPPVQQAPQMPYSDACFAMRSYDMNKVSGYEANNLSSI
jgi:hypothetical protein